MGGRLRFRSLASSSVYGNAYLVESMDGDGVVPVRILIDCGLPLRRLEAALGAMGITPPDIDAIFISHEHSDHINSLRIRIPFPQRHRIPVYATTACWAAMANVIGHIDDSLRRFIEPGEGVKVEPGVGVWSGAGAGPVIVRALPKSHDAADPVGFILDTAEERLGVVTDLGTVDGDLFAALRGAEYLIFESNHDVAMQWASGRPYTLMQRVLGSLGHLSNDQSAGVLAHLADSNTKAVLLAHLSTECNRPDLALQAVRLRLTGGGFRGRLGVAPPGHASDPFGV